jgi:hypothetical protein
MRSISVLVNICLASLYGSQLIAADPWSSDSQKNIAGTGAMVAGGIAAGARAAAGAVMPNMVNTARGAQLPGRWGKTIKGVAMLTGTAMTAMQGTAEGMVLNKVPSDKKRDKMATDTAIDFVLTKTLVRIPGTSGPAIAVKAGASAFSNVVRAAANVARSGVDSSTNALAVDRALEQARKNAIKQVVKQQLASKFGPVAAASSSSSIVSQVRLGAKKP